jgi:GT2 family glycosyltransferase
MKETSVAVISYNTRELVRCCLESLQTQQAAELLVVDNASTDGTPQMVVEQFPYVRLAENAVNAGFGAAVNIALRNTSSKYLLVLNSDTKVEMQAVTALQQYLNDHPRVAFLGPRLLDSNGRLQRSCRQFPGTFAWLLDNGVTGFVVRRLPPARRLLLNAWDHDRSRRVPWVVGAAFVVRVDALRSIGGFDERFFLFCEEIDVCYRLRNVGWETHYTPDATVLHVGGASRKSGPSRSQQWLAESTNWFYRKHYTGIRRVALLTMLRATVLMRRLVAAIQHGEASRSVRCDS